MVNDGTSNLVQQGPQGPGDGHCDRLDLVMLCVVGNRQKSW